MPTARYQLPQHPTLSGPHTKQELYVLVERGSWGAARSCWTASADARTRSAS